jgi:hypothetical protein
VALDKVSAVDEDGETRGNGGGRLEGVGTHALR